MARYRMKEVSMRLYRFFAWLFMCWPLMLTPAWSVAQPKQAKALHIEPQAAQVLKHMTEYLQGLQQFSVQAEVVSELVVRWDHSCQGQPEVIEEIRRIFLQHAATPGNSRQGGGA